MTTDERTTTFTAGPGGVMTDEVGVITGELTLRTTVDDGAAVRQTIQYRDADEWYAVTGAPATVPAGASIDSIHCSAVETMTRGQQ